MMPDIVSLSIESFRHKVSPVAFFYQFAFCHLNATFLCHFIICVFNTSPAMTLAQLRTAYTVKLYKPMFKSLGCNGLTRSNFFCFFIVSDNRLGSCPTCRSSDFEEFFHSALIIGTDIYFKTLSFR